MFCQRNTIERVEGEEVVDEDTKAGYIVTRYHNRKIDSRELITTKQQRVPLMEHFQLVVLQKGQQGLTHQKHCMEHRHGL